MNAGQTAHGPHFLITAEGEIHGEDTPESREIVRRIHACVNACDGLSTDELENGVVADMRRVIAQVVPLLQERAEKNAPGETAPAEAPPKIVVDGTAARN